MGLFELLNELVAVDLVGGEPMLGRHKPQGGGQVGFTYPGRRDRLKFCVNDKLRQYEKLRLSQEWE